MDLGKMELKNFERKDIESMRVFAQVINERDNQEITIPEHAIEYILSNDELRKGFFIAYYENKIIGFASCMSNISQSENANFELIIHPDYRKQGLGGMMYEKILELAKKRGVKNAIAFAKERMQDSVDFIESKGFRVQRYSWKMDLNLETVDYRIMPVELCNIRTITLEDNKDYVAIMNAGFKKEDEELYTEKSFEMTLSNPDTYVFFIEHEGKIAATAAINMERDISRGYIHNVTVYSQFRGKGFGQAAINHCINTIKKAGLNKATLNVYGDNKSALHLYKKLGFVEIDSDIMFKGEI